MEAAESKKVATEAAAKKIAANDSKAKPEAKVKRNPLLGSPTAGPVTVDATPENVKGLFEKTLAAGDKDQDQARVLRTTALALGEEQLLALDLGTALDGALALPRMEAVFGLFGDSKAAKAAVDAALTMVKD